MVMAAIYMYVVNSKQYKCLGMDSAVGYAFACWPIKCAPGCIYFDITRHYPPPKNQLDEDFVLMVLADIWKHSKQGVQIEVS